MLIEGLGHRVQVCVGVQVDGFGDVCDGSAGPSIGRSVGRSVGPIYGIHTLSNAPSTQPNKLVLLFFPL